MKKLFYNAVLNFDVEDISGTKTKAQIVKEFGGEFIDWKEISFNEKVDQCTRLDDGTFEKKTHVEVQQEIDKERNKKQKKISNKARGIFQKLGLTKEEAKILLQASKELDEENIEVD